MTMRKLGLILLMAALAITLVIGCTEEDPKPKITRLTASAVCGVVPMRVDFRADATGGTPFAEPTGVNNWLQMIWDFGDGTVIENGTSIAYHFYTEPDTYTVTVTGVDESGFQSSRDIKIVALQDSLANQPFTIVGEDTTDQAMPCRPMEFGVRSYLCFFDSEDGNYDDFVMRWEIGDSVYTGNQPEHTFMPVDVGQPLVRLILEDPARSITQRDTIFVEVYATSGLDLAASTDWLLSPPQGAAQDTIFRDIESFPDQLIYTLTLANDGPDDAYHPEFFGELPSQVEYVGVEINAGEFEYTIDGRDWVLTTPFLAAGDEITMDFEFILAIGSTRDAYRFDTNIGSIRTIYVDGQAEDDTVRYACDVDPLTDVTIPVLYIVSAPSDIGLAAHWQNNFGQPSDTDTLVYSVPFLPDTTIVYSIQAQNQGPSTAWDVVVDGYLPDDPRITFREYDAPDNTQFTYDAVTKHWVWNIESIARSRELDLDLRFALETATVGEVFVFPAEMAVHPDDPDLSDLMAAAVLIIRSIP